MIAVELLELSFDQTTIFSAASYFIVFNEVFASMRPSSLR